MDYLYGIRDSFFWWTGVWATVTLVNHGVMKFLRKRRLKHELVTFTEFENARLDDVQETQADTDTESEPEEGTRDGH